MASLCTRPILRAGQRPTVSRSTLLFLKRQLATDVESTSSPLHQTPPPPPPPVTITPSPDTTTSSKSDPTRTNAGKSEVQGGRKKKSKYGELHTLETMPYVAYRESLKVIKEDREEKLKKIRKEREHIKNLIKYSGVAPDDKRILTAKEYIDTLLLQIDMNNPRIKYMYDMGNYNIHKPIYHHWNNEEWRSMRRKILMQRLTQMDVVPDVLPDINPIVDVDIKFRRKRVSLGSVVPSSDVRYSPSVKVTPFDSKERLCTVVVVDPDLPNFEKNSFDYYLQWLVVNVPVSIENQMAVGRSDRKGENDVIVDYETPYVHRGQQYHRYCLFVLEQNGRIDPASLGKTTTKPASTTKKDSKEAKSDELPSSGALNITANDDGKTEDVLSDSDSATRRTVEVQPIIETGTKAISDSTTSELNVSPQTSNDAQTNNKSDTSAKTAISNAQSLDPKEKPAKPVVQSPEIQRKGFVLRSFMKKQDMKPIGAFLWRCKFDDTMMDLMKNIGIPTWNVKLVKEKD